MVHRGRDRIWREIDKGDEGVRGERSVGIIGYGMEERGSEGKSEAR